MTPKKREGASVNEKQTRSKQNSDPFHLRCCEYIQGMCIRSNGVVFMQVLVEAHREEFLSRLTHMILSLLDTIFILTKFRLFLYGSG